MSLLECRNLYFSYPRQKGSSLSVLKDFNFILKPGEIISLLGPSGCGKTTALNLLSGFLKADKGSVEYHGTPLLTPFSAGQMIFQDSNQLLPWLTVEDNILFPVSRRPFPGRKPGTDAVQKKKLETVLHQVGLQNFRDYHPSSLSGGMKQRCALGRALMADAEILYMDEPFGALDSPSRRELQRLLLKLWSERGFSVVFVTHDISEALTLSDRILLFGTRRIEDISVTLKRPRDRKEKSFKEMEYELYSSLADTEN